MNNYEFRGCSPQIAGDAWVAATATVVGDVHLESGASLWFGAVARADSAAIRIGAGTNVQDNSVLHTDAGFPLTLGRNVSVGHAAVLHGCMVGDDVLVGLGAMIMNGARVGAGSLVAAGALITEGTDIPPGSLVVGVPARVARPVTDQEAAKIRENARLYGDLTTDWLAAEASSRE